MEGMKDPKVTTDRTVDASSLEAIISDVVRPGMDEEEKALALCRYLCRTMYHYGWPYMRPEVEEHWHDPVKLINVHGYSLCGARARVLGRLYGHVFGEQNVRLIGLTESEPGAWRMDRSPGAFIDTARLRDYDPATRAGHTSLEVRYGGRWRLIDPHVYFYAYRREGGLASAQDLIRDPSLVTKPARRVRGLLPCGDLRRVFYASRFRSWGKLTREAAPDDHSMAISLRRGETYTRYWDRRGRFYWFVEMDRRWDPEYLEAGPRHVCEGDEPWRHYGNGELVYRQQFADVSYRDAVTEEKGLTLKPGVGLLATRAGRRGEVGFAVRVPYLVVESHLEYEATRRTGSDTVRVWVRRRGGRWRLAWEEPSCGRVRRKLGLSPWLAGKYGYDVRFELVAARRVEDAVLHEFTLETRFMLNYLALPQLLPGRNRVTVTAADPRELREQKLQVTYAWTDEDGEQENRRIVKTSPCSYQIEVGKVTTRPRENPKYMRFLRLAVS